MGAAAPDQLLILSGAEQEYLLRVIEAAVKGSDLSMYGGWVAALQCVNIEWRPLGGAVSS